MRDPTWITPPRAGREGRSVGKRPAKGRAALTHSPNKTVSWEMLATVAQEHKTY